MQVYQIHTPCHEGILCRSDQKILVANAHFRPRLDTPRHIHAGRDYLGIRLTEDSQVAEIPTFGALTLDKEEQWWAVGYYARGGIVDKDSLVRTAPADMRSKERLGKLWGQQPTEVSVGGMKTHAKYWVWSLGEDWVTALTSAGAIGRPMQEDRKGLAAWVKRGPPHLVLAFLEGCACERDWSVEEALALQRLKFKCGRFLRVTMNGSGRARLDEPLHKHEDDDVVFNKDTWWFKIEKNRLHAVWDNTAFASMAGL